MLTALALVPASDSSRALVLTGDRDEHIRVSRFPNGHNIERFLFGSTKFVSALAFVPATATTPAAVVSGGGDAALLSFNLLTGERLATIPIEDTLLPKVIVAPLPPAPVKPGKKKPATRAKGKAAAAAEGTTESGAATPALEKSEAEGEAAGGDVYEVVEEDVEPEDGEELDGDEGEIREEGVAGEEAFVRREYGMHAWKDGVTTGLAVQTILPVEGGVIVLTSGLVLASIACLLPMLTLFRLVAAAPPSCLCRRQPSSRGTGATCRHTPRRKG